MEAIQLIRIGFDSLENREPWYEELEATFVDSPDKNRYMKLQEYFKDKTFRMYTGYDHEIYPKFKVQNIKIQ